MDLKGKTGLSGRPGINAQVALGDEFDVLIRDSMVEAVADGDVYSACNSAAITFGTALTATGVTFHLHNPSGSGVNLEVLHTAVAILTCTASGTILYAANRLATAAAPATNTAITVVNNLIGNTGQGQGLAYSISTLPSAPLAVRVLGSGILTAANAAPTTIHDYPRGTLIVAPGCVLSIQGLTIVGTGIISMQWREKNL